MSDYDLAVYYYEEAIRLSNVATTLLWVAGVLAILLLIFIGTTVHASRERDRLREELAQQNDPAYQLAIIRELGEAGRREVRRLAHEAQHAMVVAGGRR